MTAPLALFDLDELLPAQEPEQPSSFSAEIPESSSFSGIIPALDHHAHAFAAVARCYAPDHPALVRPLDPVALARFANEVLRGVASDRPALTPQRWAQASRTLIDAFCPEGSANP